MVKIFQTDITFNDKDLTPFAPLKIEPAKDKPDFLFIVP